MWLFLFIIQVVESINSFPCATADDIIFHTFFFSAKKQLFRLNSFDKLTDQGQIKGIFT